MNDAVLVQVAGGEEALTAGAAHAGGAVQPQVRLQVLRARHTFRVIQRSCCQIHWIHSYLFVLSGSGLFDKPGSGFRLRTRFFYEQQLKNWTTENNLT